MNRRQFGTASMAAALGASSTSLTEAADSAASYYEVRRYQLRNDFDASPLHNFVENDFIPAMKSRGVGPIGCFGISTGRHSPSLILLIQYKSLSEFVTNTELAGKSDSFSAKWKAFETKPLPYVRYDSSLLKAFANHPGIEVPKAKDGRLFELRTYESKNAVASAAKIDMFNVEEIKIFRDCGMATIFFGEGVFANRLPHLTYMLAFDDMAHRTAAWDKFRANDDWNRIKGDPRWLDTVSVIDSSFLRATQYSEIR